jgi:hypothetical protein
MKTYSLYLSTWSGKNVVNKTNLNNVIFNVNWDEIFGNQKGVCNVRLRMNTGSGTFTDVYNGSLRASFSSNFTNTNYGVNIAPILITQLTSSINVLLSDTFYTNGLTIQIPKGNQQFTISFLDRAESLMSNLTQDWQIWFYFDVYDFYELEGAKRIVAD